MKHIIKQVLGIVCISALMASTAFANTGAYGTYGTNYYQSGAYGYGQGYTGSSYQTSYYGQGYGSYSQGYQGYYGGGYNTGMGSQFAYVDNNWIEDQLRFAVTDVNQNRPYAAMSKIQSLSSYCGKYGDSALYRRLQLVSQLGYKSSLKDEINRIYTDWKAGDMRLGWESGANQSYQGQDDISKEYIIQQLNLVKQDLANNQQNRGRQRLVGLQYAIPPLGNERLVRRVYYASTINKPSQMATEVQAMIGEINGGQLVLNDTENNANNYYYGYNATSPYAQPDQGSLGGPYGQQPPLYNQGGLPGDGPRYDQGPYTETGTPGYGTVNYLDGTQGTTNYTNTSTFGPSVNGTDYNANAGTYQPATPTQTVPTQTAPTAPSGPDLAQLKANVASAYQKLKVAITEGDHDKIHAARQEYVAAQTAYEKAK